MKIEYFLKKITEAMQYLKYWCIYPIYERKKIRPIIIKTYNLSLTSGEEIKKRESYILHPQNEKPLLTDKLAGVLFDNRVK